MPINAEDENCTQIISFDISFHSKGVIPEAIMGNVFIDFNHLDERALLNKTGLGLRMSMNKLLVEQMAGKISFESQINKGTKFTVSFTTISNVGSCDVVRNHSSRSNSSESFSSQLQLFRFNYLNRNDASLN